MLLWMLPLFVFVYYSLMAYVCLVHNIEEKIGPGAVAGFVCLWTSFMAGLSAVEANTFQYQGRTIHFARYGEWIVNSPLLVYLICEGYGMDPVHMYQTMVYSLSFCLAGFTASLTTVLWLKLLLTMEGSVCAAIVMFNLWRLSYQPKKPSRVAFVNLLMASLTWPLYIFAWGLGPDLFAIIPAREEAIYETTLSLVLKTTAVLYTLTDAEFSHVWEFPTFMFGLIRSFFSLHR